MAFDKIFQGTPGASAPVDAPGTLQSPALGIDVVNNELYVSAGNGWQELGAGGGGGGNLSGTLTAGKYPVASGANTLVDGTIDYGVTTPDGITIANAGSGGIAINDSGGGGIDVEATSGPLILNGGDVNIASSGNDTGISIVGDVAVSVSTTGTTGGIELANNGTGGTQITDSGGGGINISETAAGGVFVYTTGDFSAVAAEQVALTGNGAGIVVGAIAGAVTLAGVVVPGIIFSVAGTPLPDPTLTPGASAFVSDATVNTYALAYVGGGAIVAPVYSDGTTWLHG